MTGCNKQLLQRWLLTVPLFQSRCRWIFFLKTFCVLWLFICSKIQNLIFIHIQGIYFHIQQNMFTFKASFMSKGYYFHIQQTYSHFQRIFYIQACFYSYSRIFLFKHKKFKNRCIARFGLIWSAFLTKFLTYRFHFYQKLWSIEIESESRVVW